MAKQAKQLVIANLPSQTVAELNAAKAMKLSDVQGEFSTHIIAGCSYLKDLDQLPTGATSEYIGCAPAYVSMIKSSLIRSKDKVGFWQINPQHIGKGPQPIMDEIKVLGGIFAFLKKYNPPSSRKRTKVAQATEGSETAAPTIETALKAGDKIAENVSKALELIAATLATNPASLQMSAEMLEKAETHASTIFNTLVMEGERRKKADEVTRNLGSQQSASKHEGKRKQA